MVLVNPMVMSVVKFIVAESKKTTVSKIRNFLYMNFTIWHRTMTEGSSGRMCGTAVKIKSYLHQLYVPFQGQQST